MGGTRLAFVSFFRNIGSPRNALKGVKVQQILQLVRLQVAAIVIFILLHLFVSFGHVLNIAFVIVAWNLARLCVKYLYDFLPKSTITTLHDKAVFITGCDTGFGNALARQLDKKGVTVFAGCLFSEGPDALKLKQECSDKLHIVQMDVTKDDDVRDAVQMVQKKLDGEKLWAIVNNAGIAILGEAEYMSIESYKKVMEVNVFGVARVTQAFLPLLRHSRGRVVIVASQASHISVPTSTAYSMSKSAVYSYAEGLRRELMRWNVSVHILEPWLYRTGITSTKAITNNLHREWDNAPDEVRTAYGGDSYIKQFKGIYGFTKGVSTTGSNVSEVVDCMEDAVIGEDPQLIYIPGKSGKFFSWLATGFPKELVDLICYAGIPFTGDYRRKEYKKG